MAKKKKKYARKKYKMIRGVIHTLTCLRWSRAGGRASCVEYKWVPEKGIVKVRVRNDPKFNEEVERIDKMWRKRR